MSRWGRIATALLVALLLGGCGKSTSGAGAAEPSRNSSGGSGATTGAQGGSGNSAGDSDGPEGAGGNASSASSGTTAPVGSGGGAGAVAMGGAHAAAGSSNGGGESGSAGASNQQDEPGIFDPGEVYLWGTLQEGACYRDAIAPIREPDRATTGFYCALDGSSEYYDATISPSDGRLLYRLDLRDEDDQILAFVADGDGLGDYPASPHLNDLLVVTTPCGYNSDFFVDPDDGEVVYACHDSGERVYNLEGGGRWELDQEYALVHLGYGKAALVADGTAWAIKTDSGEIVEPAMPLLLGFSVPVRARPDGFWFVTQVEDDLERWFLGLDGTATFEGVFPKPPPATWLTPSLSSCALDASGALVCLVNISATPLDDGIMRAELGAPEAELVYSETESPLVKIHISALVTGP